VHDPADHASVVGALDATHILRQMRLNPCPFARRLARTDFGASILPPIRINDLAGPPDAFVHAFCFSVPGDRIVQLIIFRSRYDV
jgi:hypothetical protein